MPSDSFEFDARVTNPALWAEQTVALLDAQLTLESTGQPSDDQIVAQAMLDGSFEDIVSDHLRAALTTSEETFKRCSREALDLLLSRQDATLALKLGDLLHEQAIHGAWLQSVPLGMAQSGALEGESTLFGLGVVLTGADSSAQAALPEDALDHVKALLLADLQVSNAFRVVLLPTLLSTAQVAGLTAWQVHHLRKRLETFAACHPNGHPDLATTQQWLVDLQASQKPQRYLDLDGRETRPSEDALVMDAYTVVGLVLHDPQDPASDIPLDEQGPVESVRFPRVQAKATGLYLEAERENLEASLRSGVLPEDVAESLYSALRQNKADGQKLKELYGPCFLPEHLPNSARATGAGQHLHQCLFDTLSKTVQAQFVTVVSAAQPFYDSMKASRDSLRYLRLRAMLGRAGWQVGLDSSAGLVAELHLDEPNHQTVVHAYHDSTGMYAGTALWPLHGWEGPSAYLTSLQSALAEAGVTVQPPTARAAGQARH